MSNFFDTVVEILKADDRFFAAEAEEFAESWSVSNGKWNPNGGMKE